MWFKNLLFSNAASLNNNLKILRRHNLDAGNSGLKLKVPREN